MHDEWVSVSVNRYNSMKTDRVGIYDALVRNLPMIQLTRAKKNESLEQINSRGERNESFDSCNSCKWLGTCTSQNFCLFR